ncbi:hypothetical protein GGH15_000606 [Coemansia sp. RSA 562]|nr:hypothetical protein GGH15_000606 [Coemansia sp. RSA 562]
MGSKIESESLYGSSIYREGHFADESDLPEYAQLCRRLFPELLGASDDTAIEPETEESLARYLKYLTGLPLPSLRMEPTLLQSDLQRISKDLAALLLNETTKDSSHDTIPPEPTNNQNDTNCRVGNTGVFDAVYKMDNLAVSAVSSISADLDKTQDALSRLEAACAQFTTDISDLDQRARVVQRVLDKQDLIARFVELPRVMQMCVAGGYYEEAVDIAEHVRLSGDRLVQDIRDGARTLPGSKSESHLPSSSRDQLLSFICGIQKQVHAEFETMVLDLCRELSFTNTSKPASVRQQSADSRPNSRRGSSDSFSPGSGSKRRLSAADGGSSYEKTMKQLAQIAKVVSILRRIGMFPEKELRMLYLRSRWQAWLQTAESLSGFAPPVYTELVSETDLASDSIYKVAQSMACVPTSASPAHTRRGSEKAHSSAEIAAYLAKYIDAFFSWLAEVELQYRTLFSIKAALEKTDRADSRDPFVDLATFASQQFLSATQPLLGLLSDASGIANLQTLVSAHTQTLSRSDIGFALSFLAESLRERAFASVVQGIEGAVSDACKTIGALSAGSSWERLAVATRPLLELPGEPSAELARDPSKFLDQYRISPVGLLQYPLLADLLHVFRNCLHALRILVLAADGESSDLGANEVLVLLSMSSVVFESELVRVAEALALCANSLLKAKVDDRSRVLKDACTAFVFGLVRNVAEIFEEVTTICDSVLDADTRFGGNGESSASLYSEAIYECVLPYL